MNRRFVGPRWQEGQMRSQLQIFNKRSAPRPRSHRKADDSGASMAEFALMLPFLVMVVFGIIEFGLAFTKAQAIEASAREGARLASIEASTVADIEARVNAALTGISMPGPPTVNVTPAPCANRPGETVTVEVITTHNLNIPLVFSNQPVDLTGTAVFRCEAST